MFSSTEKHITTGTHRVIAPEDTVARVRPHLRSMGITRVADVTGLDTIGVPVVMVSRPGARSLSVSQGKGLTLAHARASGIMESVEHFHAENIDLPLKLRTFEEMSRSHRMLDVTRLPRLATSAFHPRLRTLWIEARSLLTMEPVWAPFEMVHTNYSLPLPPGSGSFLMSSNGLASGNHPLEAIVHGACELIERDATTLFRFSSPAKRRARRLDLTTVTDIACRQILDKYASADIEVAVWDTTSDLGVATYKCEIVDASPDLARPLTPMSGMGCHPSRAVALLRALTEAAQSRLTMIAGVRDDVTYRKHAPEDIVALARAHRDAYRSEPTCRTFKDTPTFESPTLEADLTHLRDSLQSRGLPELAAVDLSRPDFKLPVFRVLLPGLEPLHDVPGYVPGPRAQQRLREHTA
ncbi:MAG: YcaO-like family protein [Polyangiaceae bacterium]